VSNIPSEIVIRRVSSAAKSRTGDDQMAGATATGEIGRIDPAQSHDVNAPKGGTRGLVIAAVVVVAAAFGAAFAIGSATKGSSKQTASSQLAPVTSVQGPQKVSITAVGAAPALPNLKSPPKPPPKPKTSSGSSSSQQNSAPTQTTPVQPTQTTPVQPTHTVTTAPPPAPPPPTHTTSTTPKVIIGGSG
jgi:hypothetical protein